MTDLQEITRTVRSDMLRQQDEWIVQQASALGVTIEELAEIYYIEYEPIELVMDPDAGGDTNRFRAVQRMRLRRREESKP